MPELPEVETVRRSLEARIVGCSVTGVIVRRREVIATPSDPEGGFSRQRPAKRRRPKRVAKPDLLVGRSIESVRRRGKQLAIVTDSGHAVLIHLGMTGELMAPGPGERLRAADHCHVLWTLRAQDGQPAGRLVFRDPRRFGGIWTLPTPNALAARWDELGPDGLTVTGAELAARLGRSARSLKAGLLDQTAVAGVGNIYADESLFDARLAPANPCKRLSAQEWDSLASSIRRILSRAVSLGGSTIRDYRAPDGSTGKAAARHQVYGRAGLPCPACDQRLISTTLAQRTTVWCPGCQTANP
ncbi:MAG: DNA-formamidopyrimidine glycosylase family protein [Planctomycetota bacterium]